MKCNSFGTKYLLFTLEAQTTKEKQDKMDVDEDYLDDFEMDKSNDSDDDASSFQFLTSAEIFALMNEELKHVDLIVEVSAIYLSELHRKKCHFNTIIVSRHYISRKYFSIYNQMPVTTKRILLSRTKWDKQELLDRITNENVANRDKFFKEAHVKNPFEELSATNRSTQQKIECCNCSMKYAQEVSLSNRLTADARAFTYCSNLGLC